MPSPSLTQQLHAQISAQDNEIVCAYLFGSQARQEATHRSDIDLAILLKNGQPHTIDGIKLDLATKIERVIRKPVDLVILNLAPADLVHRILRDGVIVFESDRSARIRFEVQSRAEYFDLLPYLKEYRRSALERQS